MKDGEIVVERNKIAVEYDLGKFQFKILTCIAYLLTTCRKIILSTIMKPDLVNVAVTEV